MQFFLSGALAQVLLFVVMGRIRRSLLARGVPAPDRLSVPRLCLTRQTTGSEKALYFGTLLGGVVFVWLVSF